MLELTRRPSARVGRARLGMGAAVLVVVSIVAGCGNDGETGRSDDLLAESLRNRPPGLVRLGPGQPILGKAPVVDPGCGTQFAARVALIDPLSGSENWTVELPASTGELVVDAGTAFVAARNNSEMPASVAAIDVASGDPVWQRFFESLGVDVADVVDGLVIAELVIGSSGRFLGIDATSGAVRWDVDFRNGDGQPDESGELRYETTEYRGMHDGVLVTETTPDGGENQRRRGGERRRVELTDPGSGATLATVPGTDGAWVFDAGVVAVIGKSPTLIRADGSRQWAATDVVPAGDLVTVRRIERSGNALILTIESPPDDATVLSLALDTGQVQWRRDGVTNVAVAPSTVLIETGGRVHGVDPDTGDGRWQVSATEGLNGYVGTEDDVAFFLLRPRQMRALELANGATPLGPLDGEAFYSTSTNDHVGVSRSGMATDFGDVVDAATGTWGPPRSDLFARPEPDQYVTGTITDAGLLAFVTRSTPECYPD